MVGYDTKYKRDENNEGYMLSVFMHWDIDEDPPLSRKNALKRLKGVLDFNEELLRIGIQW